VPSWTYSDGWPGEFTWVTGYVLMLIFLSAKVTQNTVQALLLSQLAGYIVNIRIQLNGSDKK